MAISYLDKTGLQRFWENIKAKFVVKEFKTGSSSDYKVLSDNNLTDDLVSKIMSAGDSSFDGQYASLTGKPSIGGHELASGDQTAASLGLATPSDITTATADMATQTWVNSQGFQKAADVSSAITTATSDMATQTWVGEQGFQNATQVGEAIDTKIAGMATQTWVEGKGYQTAEQVGTAIDGKIGDMATQTWVNSQGFQKAADVSSAITTATSDMATKTWVEDKGYVTSAEVNSAISSSISTVYTPKGSVASVGDLADKLAGGKVGDVYNVQANFTTDDTFIEGSGKYYPAGTNVVLVDESGHKWDVLSGSVDLSNYVTSDALGQYAKTSDITPISNGDIDSICQ